MFQYLFSPSMCKAGSVYVCTRSGGGGGGGGNSNKARHYSSGSKNKSGFIFLLWQGEGVRPR
jgi:hypothetical protein